MQPLEQELEKVDNKPSSSSDTNKGNKAQRSSFSILVECIGKWLYNFFAYSPLSKKYLKELVFQSIPVLLAASFSTFITSLITYIAGNSPDHANNECGQAIVYALLAYGIGYYFTLYYKSELDLEEKSSGIIRWLEKEEYSEIIFGFLAENSAFAWREFVNTFVLKIIFTHSGYGAAIGAWLICVLCFCGLTVLSGLLMKRLACNQEYKDLLIEYDADSFAFPLAFAITVLWAVAAEEISANAVSKKGLLFSSWKDDEGGSKGSVFNPLYYVYCILISSVVALILVIEDRYCFKCFKNIEEDVESHNPRISHASEDIIAETQPKHNPSSHSHSAEHSLENVITVSIDGLELRPSTQRKLEDREIYKEWIELWHNFLGCMVGVAFYTLIVDEFVAYGGRDSILVVFLTFLVAILVTWRGPVCVAGTIEKQALAQERFAQRHAQNEATGRRVTLCDSIMEWYLHLELHRRGTTLISLRLIIGWTWETAITSLINLFADAGRLSERLVVVVNLCITVLTFLVAIVIHNRLKKIESTAKSEPQDISKDPNLQTAVNPLQDPAVMTGSVQSESMDR